MKRALSVIALAVVAMALSCVANPARAASGQSAGAQDNDQTLRAMRDEMARSKTRLELKIPGTNEPVKPYYVEYRLLDLDVREVVGQFGTLLTSTHTRNRFMDVEARVGNYKLDSSNFIGDEGFRGGRTERQQTEQPEKGPFRPGIDIAEGRIGRAARSLGPDD